MRIEKDGNIKNSNFKVQQFNNNVDKRSFVIDRLFFGNYETGDDETKNLYENNPIDLVDCNVSILLTNPDDKINEGANLYITNLNGDTPTTEDDKISINWLLDRNITNYSGKRSFQLVFSKNNGDIVLRTKVMSFNVLSSLDTEENIIEVAPSLIQEWENKLNTVLNQSNDFNTYADNKINEKIENKMYFYKESMQEITTSIENENNFPITMQNYNKDNCITQINVNGIRNTAYTINELNEVVFNTPIKVIGTKIQIFILKAIVSDSIDLNTLKGDKGDKGEGIPTGGTTGQVLSKKSNTNYDYEWTNNEATVEVIDNLTSTDTTKPLSANMGKVLNDKINNYKPTLLWTNSNPKANKNSFNINISISDFTWFIVEFYTDNNNVKLMSTIVEIDKNMVLSAVDGAIRYRECKINSNGIVNFGNGFYMSGITAATENESQNIPYRIYGLC